MKGEMPVKRTIRIGGASIGLVGLDAALSRVMATHAGEPPDADEAAHRILGILEGRNYIPESARRSYLEALAGLWRERFSDGGTEGEIGCLSIRILGPGCVSCMSLEGLVLSVLDEREIAADIEHVRDLDEIWRYGVFTTPALVVNDRVLCAGRLPSRAKVESLITEFLGTCHEKGDKK